MIEVNELRIGNWVHLNGINVQIDKITINEPYINKCYPIPLTPEIIEKCGFVLDKKENRVVYIKKQRNIIHRIYRLNYDCYVTRGVKIKLKSLHQLQNIYFALTGEEIEIKL